MALLSDTKARNIKPDSPQLAHGGITGLVLIPSQTKGHGKWVIRFISPVTGKRRNMGLGSYPEIGIAEVGKLGTAIREKLSLGIDPLEEKKIAPAAVPTIPDFKKAGETLHKDLLPSWKNAKHGQQWINTLTEYAFPTLGSLQLSEIQPKHIADVLRPIWLSKAETASRLKQRIHAVMAWGWAHGHCSANPVDVVHHLLPAQPGKAVRTEHQPAMPWRDIPAFLANHVRNREPYDLTRAMLELLILTAARSGEIRGMTWSEVNLEAAIWTIPPERMKAKMQHRIPLTPSAVALLKSVQGLELHKTLVFPTPRTGGMFSDMVLSSFLRRVKAGSDSPDRVATAHGFRSSFRDWCSEQGYPRDLAERALAHTVENKVEAAYHRTDLLEQRRPMMQAWSDFCTGATSKPPSLAEGFIQSLGQTKDSPSLP